MVPTTEIVRQLQVGRRITKDNILVLYRVGDEVGQEVAEYYQSQRGISAANVLGVDMTWTPASTTITVADLMSVCQQIYQHVSTNGLTIKALLSCHWFPYTSTGGAGVNPYVSKALGGYRWWGDGRAAPATDDVTDDYYPSALISEYPSSMRYEGGNQSGDNGSDRPGYGALLPDPQTIDATSYVIPHFRLEVAPVSASDPVGSGLVYLKRIIDDTLEAEAAQYSDFGTVIAQGSAAGLDVAYPVYQELRDPGVRYNRFYWRNLTAEIASTQRGIQVFPQKFYRSPDRNNYLYRCVQAGTCDAVDPGYSTSVGTEFADGTATMKCVEAIPSNVQPTGANMLVPVYPGSSLVFVSISDVFLRAIGTDSYYNGERMVESRTDFSYRTGAICCFSQSLGSIPEPFLGIDFEYGTTQFDTKTATNCLNTWAYLLYSSTNAPTNKINAVRIQCTAAVTTATIEFSSGNLVLREDGTPVATIALSGTPREQFEQIITGMTGLVDWSLEMYYSQARCDSALKAGAAFAYGAFREPASGAPRAHRLVWSLWNGLNMAEWIQGEQTMESGTLNLLGDPLYCPFGHRE